MALAGRLAVVSGAGSGIGRAVANKLSKQGAVVGLLDIDSKCMYCSIAVHKVDPVLE